MLPYLLTVSLSAAPLYIQQLPVEKLPQDWQIPVAGPVTNPFGNSYVYYSIYRGGHTGVDIRAARGAPVVAPAGGKVVRVFQVRNQRYGNYVIVQHAPRLYSLYGHLQKIAVKPGQKLVKGQPLGTVGVTGAAGYPHLHFEVFSHLPTRDGAWGYLYICRKKPPEASVSFVNLQGVSFSTIHRGFQQQCKPVKMKEPMTYYNPELFWSQGKSLPTHVVAQPQNEERRYRKSNSQTEAKPSAHPLKPVKSGKPTVRQQPQPSAPVSTAIPSPSRHPRIIP